MADSDHKKPLCDFLDVVAFVHNELWQSNTANSLSLSSQRVWQPVVAAVAVIWATCGKILRGEGDINIII